MDLRNSFLDNFIEAICIFGVIGGIILAAMTNYVFLVVSIVFLSVLVFWKRRKRKKNIQLYKETLKKQWAKEHIEKRDFLHIRELYDFLNGNTNNDFTIDDISWRDLNMDSVFSKIDHTKSFPGMQQLYNILRNPKFDNNILINRNNLINSFMKEKEISQEVQYPLSILGKKQSKEVFSYFKDGLDIKTNPLALYRILSFLSYASIVLLLFNRQFGFTALVAILSINAWIYQSNKYKIEAEMEIFRYISNLVKCAESLIKIDTKGIDINQGLLEDLLRSTRKISKNVLVLNTNYSSRNEMQIIMDYINMLTLREAIIFYKTINLINKHKNELFEMYNLVGEIDAYISIASYKYSLDYFNQPVFVEGDNRFYLSAEKLYHPLLEKAVPYTFEFNNKGALVTGSNASGKSTFLRTIGVNALFGQTLYFVLASNYKTNYFKLLSSIGTTDSIEEGDSYFMAEAKSLKRIIDELDKEQSVLCILDEIFRGTNTAERISAASQVLEYMSRKNCCVVAATHDLELTSIIDERYNNYHFKELIEENDIIFDYILHNGPTTSRNAIAILRYLNYPKEIYEKAYEDVDKYISF